VNIPVITRSFVFIRCDFVVIACFISFMIFLWYLWELSLLEDK
jgi:hypothetical protein